MKRNFSARLLALTMALVLIIAITGCVNVSEDQAERRIKSYIFTRYGTNYEIGYISFKENQMFGGGSYHTTVTEKESGLSFSVICSGFSGKITDNYAQTLYEDQMDEKVESILESCPFVSEIELGIVWKTSPVGWKPSMSFDEFFEKYSNVDILVGLGINDVNPSQRSQELWELFQELNPDHNNLSITLWCALEPYHGEVMISGEEAEDFEYICQQLKRLEELDEQIKQSRQIVEEYPFVELVDLDVDCFVVYLDSDGEHVVLDFKLGMSEEEPVEKAEDVYEMCCRLKSQEFEFSVMIINTVQLSSGEEKTDSEMIYHTDMDSLEDIKEILLKLGPFPEETVPIDQTQKPE